MFYSESTFGETTNYRSYYYALLISMRKKKRSSNGIIALSDFKAIYNIIKCTTVREKRQNSCYMSNDNINNFIQLRFILLYLTIHTI